MHQVKQANIYPQETKSCVASSYYNLTWQSDIVEFHTSVKHAFRNWTTLYTFTRQVGSEKITCASLLGYCLRGETSKL